MLKALLLLATAEAAFYLPGVAPRSFVNDERVPLQVNKLTSTKTQLPYDYWSVYGLHGCTPRKRSQAAENLGSVLSGDQIESSPYKLHMRRPQACQPACRTTLKKNDVKRFQQLVEDDYHVHWIVDNLPCAMRLEDPENPTMPYFARGFPVGFSLTSEEGRTTYYLNNHVTITIRYHEDETQFEGSRVVGFEVEPYSVDHTYDDEEFDAERTVLNTCNEMNPVGPSSDALYERLDTREHNEVIFTYNIRWVYDETPWANRWDVYLRGSPDDQVHWFSIVNSLMIVVFLTGMVAMIMLRTLHRDIAAYNDADDQEETGWKLVHADVFRPPQHSMLFSVLAGTGCQVLTMTVATMTFALLGFLSPANRGGLLTALLLLFVFMGSFAGYNSARLYKTFHGKEWKRNTLLTAFLYPGLIFSIFFCLNLVSWSEGSASAVPLSSFFALLVLWFGISVPLVFLGSYFGFKKDPIELPTRTNQIERQIPEQLWYMQPHITILLGGVLPFASCSIELFFIMGALWLHQIYYIFGFLVLVLIILAATCAEITIVMAYFQLCSEDYHWWWRSFLSAASSALYVFAYSCWYYETSLDIDGASSTVLYFGYMAMISITFALLTGCVGFYATFQFIRVVYASVKVD